MENKIDFLHMSLPPKKQNCIWHSVASTEMVIFTKAMKLQDLKQLPKIVLFLQQVTKNL